MFEDMTVNRETASTLTDHEWVSEWTSTHGSQDIGGRDLANKSTVSETVHNTNNTVRLILSTFVAVGGIRLENTSWYLDC